jgi:hypothetical protein
LCKDFNRKRPGGVPGLYFGLALLSTLLATLAGLVLPALLLATLAGLVLATLLTTLVLLAALLLALVLLIGSAHRFSPLLFTVVRGQRVVERIVPHVI